MLKKASIPYREISSGKLRRYSRSIITNILDLHTLKENISDSFNVLKGIKESFKIIGEFKPDTIFIKGGYVGLPVGIAASFKKIPFFIHESDIIPGLTNKILAKKASLIFVSFPLNFFEGWSKEKLIYSGNPIRKEILDGSREKGIKKFGLKPDLPVILVMGGSQGAQTLNKAVLGASDDLLKRYQIIHISGKTDFSYLQEKTKNFRNYQLFGFLEANNLRDAYAACDLIISRAGANALFEIAAHGKASLLIPLEWATGNHQCKNALFFQNNQAALVLEQKNLSPQSLIKKIDFLFSNPKILKEMGERAKKLSKINAAKIIAAKILAFQK